MSRRFFFSRRCNGLHFELGSLLQHFRNGFFFRVGLFVCAQDGSGVGDWLLAGGLVDRHFNVDYASSDHVQLLCSAPRKVHDATSSEGASVGHFHDDAFPVPFVDDLQQCAEGMFLVCTVQAVVVVAQPATHLSALHAF